MVTVAFIGAGSIEFTRNVVTDLCSYPELAGQGLHLALHDISPERLEFAEALTRKLVAQTGANATVSASAERGSVLDGARYVINEVQVGGYAATRSDFDIPARYGVRQTIGDTLGIGGIFRGLRTIPVVTALATDMVRYCPDAYLLNYSNPMAMLPWAVYAGTDFRNVFGLCHSVRDTHAFLTGLVGADPASVRFVTAGFNHQAFVLRFEQDGVSLYPRLAEVIDGSPELQRRVRVELYRRFGYFPTESSEHSAEYVPWFMRHDDQVDRYRIFVGDYLSRSEENLAELAALQYQLTAGADLEMEPVDELASQFIHSVETGTEREIYVNVRNGGLISSLPDDCCVEVPCQVSAGSAKPQSVGPLPPQLAALNRTFLNVVELTVAAALEGSRDHVYQAALLDPNTAATLTVSQTVAMVDELLAAHAPLLPAGLR
ncbi:MAG TPA: alpha-glucosidase/alpha-galactosidase [Streptosporangiaceae bacterium]|nr:alpha-glucosidase/alpha-galactosidase [Streptosporangiaceae bacterium]